MSNDKKTTLSDINKNMESIRELTEQSKKITEPYKKKLDAINNNAAFQVSKRIQDKLAKFSLPLSKFNTGGAFGKIKVLDDALKNKNLKGLEKVQRTIPTPYIPSLGKIDNRNRAERKEDFEVEMLKIDQKKITLLIDVWEKLKNNKEITPNEVIGLKEDTINTLIKYQRTINTFKELNSDLAVQLDYKKNELKFITQADWKNKFRLFFFRVLWTLLFISSLFAVGYIEHEYEWAHLPMSKYFGTQNMSVKK